RNVRSARESRARLALARFLARHRSILDAHVALVRLDRASAPVPAARLPLAFAEVADELALLGERSVVVPDLPVAAAHAVPRRTLHAQLAVRIPEAHLRRDVRIAEERLALRRSVGVEVAPHALRLAVVEVALPQLHAVLRPHGLASVLHRRTRARHEHAPFV